eukprot:COSAG01_NODE_21927_length_879_cov_1.053846_2_plen_82_part_00
MLVPAPRQWTVLGACAVAVDATVCQASLICLEEVQPDHYKEIEASLVALGYGGVYSPKMGADGRPIPAFRGRTIGNALFYR